VTELVRLEKRCLVERMAVGDSVSVGYFFESYLHARNFIKRPVHDCACTFTDGIADDAEVSVAVQSAQHGAGSERNRWRAQCSRSHADIVNESKSTMGWPPSCLDVRVASATRKTKLS